MGKTNFLKTIRYNRRNGPGNGKQERIQDKKWATNGKQDKTRVVKWTKIGNDTIRETLFFNKKQEKQENIGTKQYNKRHFQQYMEKVKKYTHKKDAIK